MWDRKSPHEIQEVRKRHLRNSGGLVSVNGVPQAVQIHH